MAKLTRMQERFALEYAKCLNASEAARRAGSRAERANQAGLEFLSNPDVKALVDELIAQHMEERKIDADWILDRLKQESEADVSDLYDDHGALLPVHEWPLIWRQGLVHGIETSVSEDGVAVVKVRLSDRVKRLEMLGKHIKVNAFSEKVEVDIKSSLGERLLRAEQRLKEKTDGSDEGND